MRFTYGNQRLTYSPVDSQISQGLSNLIFITMSMLTKFSAVVLFSPVFLLPSVVVASLGGWCGQLYMRSQLPVKREMSNARAPVLGHFGATVAGLSAHHTYDDDLISLALFLQHQSVLTAPSKLSFANH
jgi:hypothetical protein